MDRAVWLEGFLLIATSIISGVESLRLIFYKDPYITYDRLGPGYYLLLVSMGLFITGVIYVSSYLRKRQSAKVEKTSKGMRFRLFSSIVACILYLLLIDMVGYIVASFVFFALEFRIGGIRSWPFSVALSAGATAVFYFVFVKYCNMVFPTGLLF